MCPSVRIGMAWPEVREIFVIQTLDGWYWEVGGPGQGIFRPLLWTGLKG